MLRLNRCQKCLQILADKTRAQVVELLASSSPLSVNTIVSHFSLRQPTISHHLHLLKKYEFVNSYKKGNQVYYSLNLKCKNVKSEDCIILSQD